mgnify:CR=1 FL=1
MKLELIKASDVEIKEVEWLWYPYIPYGKVTVLQGDSGDGKSTFVLNLAAMLSRGEPMPFTDGSGQEPVNIIYQSSEDDADDTIVPRFVKAGGDPNRLIFISEKEKYLSFSDERLLEAVRKTNAKLIVLDPLSAYIGEETRINTANEIRRQFRPLIELAKEQRCAILIVHHMNKAIGQKAINRSVGSVDIIAAARSALLIGRTDKDRPDERILAQVKSNLAPTGNAIVFSVSDGKVEWLEETAKTADEVLGNVFAAVGRPDTQMQQAKDILIHRVDLAALPVAASWEETAALFTNTKYSRLLVYQDSIDHILGTIHRKDFYVGCGVTGKPIAELLSPTIFAPENEPISLLLKKMQQGKTHVAVVVDEYGGTCGIVTMEDILEELVGEIWDEHEQEEIPIRETAEHTYLVDAGMNFDDFADFFHLKTDSEMVSVSGWVMERCGGVPESGDRFTYDDLDVLVVKVDHHRIEELRVTQRPHAGEKVETALIGEMAHE